MSQSAVVSPGDIDANLSSAAFHKWARHFYKCRQDFQNPDDGYSPIPYFLLCRAVELQLKSFHLKTKTLGCVKDYGHDLIKAYEDLPDVNKTLSDTELETLRKVNSVYFGETRTDKSGHKRRLKKRFEYFNPEDALHGFSDFRDLDALDEIARKLIEP